MQPDKNDPFLAIEGAYNFRDIGGLEAGDGRKVARGRVYRSGALSGLDNADQTALAELGIRWICDFRSTPERSRRPTRAPALTACEIWTYEHEEGTAELRRALTAAGATGESARSFMQETYKTLAYGQTRAYRALFRQLANGVSPVLFHCSAGKDRTGVAAALLLDVLGVPRDAIVEEYALSNRYFEHARNLLRSETAAGELKAIDESVLSPVLRADPDYIVAMFSAVEGRHGSAEGFLIEELELSKRDVEALRELLLAG